MRLLFTAIIVVLHSFLVFSQFPGNGVVFNPYYIPKIYIHVDEADLDQLYEPANWYANDYYQATFIFESQGVKDTVENVGLRFRGNTSRQKIKKSFKVSFNEFESGRRYRGLKKLNLNAETNDPSMIRSRACFDFFRKYNVASSRTNHIELYVNDEFYGLYQNIEHVDGDFIKKYFGNKKGNLYKGSYPCDLTYISNNPDDYKGMTYPNTRIYDLKTNKELDDYTKLAQFIDFLNNADDEDFNCKFSEYFNVVNYLKIAAIDVLLGNWDGYIFNSNNYYLYENLLTNRFEYIPYDLDNTWGLDWFGPQWASRNIYQYDRSNEPRPLYTRLMAQPQYRDIFTWYIKKMLDEYYNSTEHRQHIINIHDFITPSALSDPYRPLDFGYSETDFLNALTHSAATHIQQGVLGFANIRKQKAYEQLEEINIAPFITEIKTDYNTLPDYFTLKVFTDGPPVGNAKLKYFLNGASQNEIVIEAGTSQNEFIFEINLSDQDTELLYNIELKGENNQVRDAYCNFKKIVLKPSVAGVVINEVVSKNKWVIADEYGEYDDWIELYNAGDVPVNLRKYYFTDKPSSPLFWKLPDITIDPGKHLLFWADGQTHQGGMHSNFSIKSSGEKIYLFKKEDEETQLIDWVDVPALSANVSYGRENDGADNWIIFSTPTPNAPNQIIDGLEAADAEKFTVFPNPTQGIVNFSKTAEFKLIDISGRVIANGRSNKTNLSELRSGLYFIVVNNRVYKISKI